MPFGGEAKDLALAVGQGVGLVPGCGGQLGVDGSQAGVDAADRFGEGLGGGVFQ
jgi:hypothetical protein